MNAIQIPTSAVTAGHRRPDLASVRCAWRLSIDGFWHCREHDCVARWRDLADPQEIQS